MVQCFKPRDDNFPSKQTIFQTYFSQPMIESIFCNSYGGLMVQRGHVLRFTVWKNQEFSLTLRIFRQIISLVISLVKTFLSRNFFQKCVRVNFRNYHSVRLPPKAVLGGFFSQVVLPLVVSIGVVTLFFLFQGFKTVMTLRNYHCHWP